MKNPIQFTKVIAPVGDSLNQSPWRRGFLLIPLALIIAFFALSPAARACDEVCDNGDNTGFGSGVLYGNTGSENTANGALALLNNATGSDNTAIGFEALWHNTTGNSNTATGANALYTNTEGSNNTATGYEALYSDFVGSYNTAAGVYALAQNDGSYNTANGASALGSNVRGNNNTATGAYAIKYGFAGDNNTATGYAAMQGTTEASNEGNDNTATGVNALFNNISGSYNTASGVGALAGNTTSNDNTATGWAALSQNSTGGDNTATGLQALLSNLSGGGNTATGVNALYSNTGGSNNIGLGIGAGGALTSGDNNIDIANAGIAGESAKIRIGTKGTHKNTYIAGIYGVTVPRGLGVIVDSSGHLGTSTSSARFKDEIKPMDKASEAVLALQPVTFRYKQELDPERIPQFGLVAEQVAKVNRDLVAFDGEGKAYTVRYEAVNAMLLNEFLKEHRRVEEQQAMIVRVNSTVAKQDTTITDLKSTVALQQKQFQATIAQQQKEIEALTAGLKKQAAQVQKVSDQLELSKAVPRIVVNNH